MKGPEFWDDQGKSAAVKQELSHLQEGVKVLEELNREQRELEELVKIVQSNGSLQEDLERQIEDFEDKLKAKSREILLAGRYDRGNAILEIMAGAGGRDAQDWTAILLRMYERYGQNQGFKVRVLEQSFGEAGGAVDRIGIKHATLEIKGRFAYGLLKKETGVHRLVRISPFSAKKLRHTSFASVEVLPDLPPIAEKEIGIEPKDLKTDTFRASGPGGQYVNRRESAVRVTHLPTGIVVTCQSERLQGENRKRALQILYAKLLRLKEEERKEKISELQEKIPARWGNQIRSYVLQPYRMIKDLRTGIETSEAEGVLDGKLDEFIEAEMRI